MVPGIWTSPFIAHETAPVTQEHPDWFLKDPDGRWILFPMNDTVYRVMDITVPEAVEWAAGLYTDLRAMGYRYHKLDFTRAAILYPHAVRHNPTVPMARAYRDAIAAIRREMGEDSYFLMCGGLYDPLIGLVDAQRTGSDVKSMWSVTAGLSPKTIPYTSKQNLLRYYLSTFWDADPDASRKLRGRQGRDTLSTQSPCRAPRGRFYAPLPPGSASRDPTSALPS